MIHGKLEKITWKAIQSSPVLKIEASLLCLLGTPLRIYGDQSPNLSTQGLTSCIYIWHVNSLGQKCEAQVTQTVKKA